MPRPITHHHPRLPVNHPLHLLLIRLDLYIDRAVMALRSHLLGLWWMGVSSWGFRWLDGVG